MATLVASCRDIASRALERLIRQIDKAPALEEPFSHVYLEKVLPDDIYEQLLLHLPEPHWYCRSAERYVSGESTGGYVRWLYQLTPANLASQPPESQELWRGLAAALTAPELKRALFTKLAKDLAYRYGVPEAKTAELAGYSRPTLYRETEGFEITPHPDTRKKVVTMHLYLPADRSQLNLGTALYRRKLLSWPFGGWQQRFEKIKQFVFQPNSGYAFVVNNTLTKKSWHGREKLPADAGVRNTLLNTFYENLRPEFSGYLA